MTANLKGWMIVVLLGGTAVYALAEDITLTTYYPSSRGVYQEHAKEIIHLREQANELIDGKFSVADQTAQETGVKNLVIWHRKGGTPVGSNQNDVAGSLASDDPAGSLERLDSLAP